jgi:hypothetical protein
MGVAYIVAPQENGTLMREKCRKPGPEVRSQEVAVSVVDGSRFYNFKSEDDPRPMILTTTSERDLVAASTAALVSATR